MAAVRRMVGKPMRVHLADGRVLAGRFYCLDWRRNVVLRDAEEWAPPEVVARESAAETAKRFLGATIMVPGRHMVRCETAAE